MFLVELNSWISFKDRVSITDGGEDGFSCPHAGEVYQPWQYQSVHPQSWGLKVIAVLKMALMACGLGARGEQGD